MLGSQYLVLSGSMDASFGAKYDLVSHIFGVSTIVIVTDISIQVYVTNDIKICHKRKFV